MGRDLQQCREFAASWYGDSLVYSGSKVSDQFRCINVEAWLTVLAVLITDMAYGLLEWH